MKDDSQKAHRVGNSLARASRGIGVLALALALKLNCGLYETRMV